MRKPLLGFVVALGLFAGAGIAAEAQAQVPTRAQIDAACRPGADPHAPGNENYPGGLSQMGGAPTPTRLPGATTVSAREAKCMIDRFGAQVVILAPLGDETLIPGSHRIEWAWRPSADQARFATELARLTAGNKDRPIVTYCHHEQCFLSYNIALRAVQAGYRQVFWLRPGISGWQKAGYAFAPRPGDVTLSDRYRTELARCRKDYGTYTAQEWANMVHQIPTEAEQEKTFRRLIADDARMLNICVGNLKDREARGAADRADLQKVLAGTQGEVERAYAAARAEMETNPARYLTMTWDSHQPAKLRSDLAILRNGKSLAQACGTFDFTQPAIGPSQNGRITQLNARRQQYSKCLETYRNDLTTVNKTFGITSANEWVKATARFTCARNRKPNCIADEPYRTIAGIATDANVAYVRQRERFFQDERAKVNDLIRRGNAWIAEVNRRIGVYNATH